MVIIILIVTQQIQQAKNANFKCWTQNIKIQWHCTFHLFPTWKPFTVLIKFQSTLSAYTFFSWFIHSPIFYTYYVTYTGINRSLLLLAEWGKHWHNITSLFLALLYVCTEKCIATKQSLLSSDCPHQRCNWYIQPSVVNDLFLRLF